MGGMGVDGSEWELWEWMGIMGKRRGLWRKKVGGGVLFVGNCVPLWRIKGGVLMGVRRC